MKREKNKSEGKRTFGLASSFRPTEAGRLRTLKDGRGQGFLAAGEAENLFHRSRCWVILASLEQDPLAR